MLLKQVYMGWKFQRTLELDVSFSLEYFFISVAIFTQVASAPLMQSYLCDWFKRTKVNELFSDWTKFLAKVPQDSIFASLLFNIFLNDIFFIIYNSNLCNYADDNTMQAINENLHVIKSNLEVNFMRKWFFENLIVLNPAKCHYMLIGDHGEPDKIKLNGTKITSSSNKNSLMCSLIKKLSFDAHIKTLCKQAGQKFSALARISC